MLEPIVKVEISAPESYMGDIAGDLASRRGQVSNTESLPGGIMEITGIVPLAELDDYATRLHAITQGTGTWSMTLDSYQPLPAQKQAELAAKYQRKEED